MLEEKENLEFCQDEENLVDAFGWEFFDKLKTKKEQLQLDFSLSTFEVIFCVVNDLLVTKKTLFKRVRAQEKVSLPHKKDAKGK